MNKKLQILEIQNHIYQLMNAKNGITVHFRYDKEGLSLITYNSKNEEFFLVNTIKSDTSFGIESELELHTQMLDYVIELLNSIDKNVKHDGVGNSYSVVWQKNNGEIQTSYFHGIGIEDVIKKFFYGKEAIKYMFNILEIKLNPIS